MAMAMAALLGASDGVAMIRIKLRGSADSKVKNPDWRE